MRSRKPWRYLFLLLLAGVALFLFREPILSEVGDFLVVSDSLETADVIVVLAGHQDGRCLKAAELFLQGWSPRIVITKGNYPHGIEQLKRYGIRELESHKKCAAILKFLKIPKGAIEIIEGYNTSTADEAQKLRRYMQHQGLRRLIVVTSNFHTRRSRLLFRRVLKGTGTITVVPAASDYQFDPDQWWTRRRDSKVLLWEYQKLIFYTLRY